MHATAIVTDTALPMTEGFRDMSTRGSDMPTPRRRARTVGICRRQCRPACRVGKCRQSRPAFAERECRPGSDLSTRPAGVLSARTARERVARRTVSLRIEKLHESIGAEITGVDLARPLTDAEVAAIERAWLEHIVLVFPGQELDQEAQLRFAGRFGVLGERSRPPEIRPEGADFHPAVMLVSNIRENGRPIGSLPDGEMWFHHDMCYVAEPYRGTMLYAIEIPSRGGNTLFANMYAAYDRLDAATRDRIAGARALQIYNYSVTEKVPLDGDLDAYPHYVQPVAIAHPRTGRKALYVNPLITARIEGLPGDESDALLEELFGFAGDRGLIYEHVWREGDLVMWDNWCSCHARTDFPETERRLLRRCTILGEALAE